MKPAKLTDQQKRERDEQLKRDFIAKKGVKKVPMAHELAPKPDIEQAWNPAYAKRMRAMAEKTKEVKPVVMDAGPKPMLTWLPIDQLHVNEEYQRPSTTKRGQQVIRGIVEHFQWKLFSIVTVTPRANGGYWLIDGQHRTIAAKLRGIEEVPAIVLQQLTPEEQARTFAGINGKRVSVNPYAIHHAMLAAGDETAVRIDRVCEAAGVVIPRYPKSSNQNLKPEECMALGEIKRGIKKYGDDLVIGVLKAIRTTYPTTVGKMNRDDLRDRMTKASFRKEFGE